MYLQLCIIAMKIEGLNRSPASSVSVRQELWRENKIGRDIRQSDQSGA